MAKVTAAEIMNLGLTYQMFGKASSAELETSIDAVIAERSAILQGKVGSSMYDSTSPPTFDYLKRAEKCLVMADLLGIRINIRLGHVDGEGKEISNVELLKQKQAYLCEARELIGGLTFDDFATGVLTTTHFDDGSTFAGLEIG
jgi:hypothetical protein